MQRVGYRSAIRLSSQYMTFGEDFPSLVQVPGAFFSARRRNRTLASAPRMLGAGKVLGEKMTVVVLAVGYKWLLTSLLTSIHPSKSCLCRGYGKIKGAVIVQMILMALPVPEPPTCPGTGQGPASPNRSGEGPHPALCSLLCSGTRLTSSPCLAPSTH